VVPAVLSPEGDWLQDSSLIIEQLERRYPAAPVLPAGPVQRLALAAAHTV
jgi:glutathione S-transferase